MLLLRWISVLTVGMAVASVACSPSASAPATSNAPSRAQASAPKRVVAAITGQAPGLNNHVNRNNSIQGVDVLQQLVNAGASNLDSQGVRRPQMALNVPSPDDGSWIVRTDGTMDTIW